jgi:hypothetical protein
MLCAALELLALVVLCQQQASDSCIPAPCRQKPQAATSSVHEHSMINKHLQKESCVRTHPARGAASRHCSFLQRHTKVWFMVKTAAQSTQRSAVGTLARAHQAYVLAQLATSDTHVSVAMQCWHINGTVITSTCNTHTGKCTRIHQAVVFSLNRLLYSVQQQQAVCCIQVYNSHLCHQQWRGL